MQTILLILFTAGYMAIAFEHLIRVNKAASALLTGVACWTAYTFYHGEAAAVTESLLHHLSGISGILFFLLGAMTVVEIIDAHDGFEVILARIRTRKRTVLLRITSLVTFFLSAVLDNLTTAIVMVSLIRKLIPEKKDRMFFAGMVVIAANAGGAWSPIGDVTTTMLWVGGQISPAAVVLRTFLPSLVCLLVPLSAASIGMKGEIGPVNADVSRETRRSTPLERNLVFLIGLTGLLSVPVFKTYTHLPPFMGMLCSLSLIWVLTEFIHHRKDEIDKERFSVNYALRKIDTPSILFFLGILLAVACLEESGILADLAGRLTHALGSEWNIVFSIGILSSIVDNVPLVAAAQGMYPLSQYGTDHFFWLFLAYCTGTGGSLLVIGSAAGVAAMGLVRMDFMWYLKRVTPWALLGYLSGAIVFAVLS